MKFEIDDNYIGCRKIYESLSEQEKKWFGMYRDGEDYIISRKLIEINGEPAGFCEVGDCGLIPGGISGDCIVYVAVVPKYRRRGIGFFLVNEVVKSFKKNGFYSLTYRVNKNNTASIKLAESCGLIRLPQDMVDEKIRETEYVYVAGEIIPEGRWSI